MNRNKLQSKINSNNLIAISVITMVLLWICVFGIHKYTVVSNSNISATHYLKIFRAVVEVVENHKHDNKKVKKQTPVVMEMDGREFIPIDDVNNNKNNYVLYLDYRYDHMQKNTKT